MFNKIGTGEEIDLLIPAGGVSAGDVVVAVSSDVYGIAINDYAAGVVGRCAVEGVFDLAANSADTWVRGQKLYWDNSAAELVDNDTTGDALIGVAADAKAAAQVRAHVKLVPALEVAA